MKEVARGNSIEKKILHLRGHRVMLSTHLAELYGVKVGNLIQAVKRNVERFPADFMFQLTWNEVELSRSQIVILKPNTEGRGRNIRYRPYAFTQEGVAMLSSVLRSRQAIEVNIAIMRAFVRLRQIFLGQKELALKLHQLETRVGKHDGEIRLIFEAIRRLMGKVEKPKRRIGFHAS